MAVKVAKHYVGSLPGIGLSQFQQDLLSDAAPVRIADAPTGTGKSYAFQMAMQSSKRILFIVPTKRLAQNLAGSLVDDLIHNDWPPQKAQRAVEIWSGDETQRLREAGMVNVQAHRLRQFTVLDQLSDTGEMIFAIPESLSYLLLRDRKDTGVSGKTILDLMTDFEHIVFDEFHTIDPRGFGLAAALSILAARRTGVRAKVSFLSATPLRLRPVLEKLGIPSDAIHELKETVGPQQHETDRAIHGDVRLHLSDAPRLVDVLESQSERIQAYLQRDPNHQMVVIYDRLDELKRQQPAWQALVSQWQIPEEKVLVINSLDDSGRQSETNEGFASGRKHSPDDFSIIFATASVEMGVTFRKGDLLFMEPGFAPMNFVQRYGRCARKGADGDVFVRVDPASPFSNPWIRDWVEWYRCHDGQSVTIHDLTKCLSSPVDKAYRDVDAEADLDTFGEFPLRSAYCAGLYWNALKAHWSLGGHRFQEIQPFTPKTAKHIWTLLQKVRKMESDRQLGTAAKIWCDRFEAQAFTLRDIGKRIRVIESEGNVRSASLTWLQRSTEVLNRGQAGHDKEGDFVKIPGVLEDYLLPENRRVSVQYQALLPHRQDTCCLKSNEDLVRAWNDCLEDNRGGLNRKAWKQYRSSMEAAQQLTRYTGLVVCDDEDFEIGAHYVI